MTEPVAQPEPWARLPAALRGRLKRLDLLRDADLVLHLPLRFEDETVLTPVAALQAGDDAQVEGTVHSAEISLRGRRQLVVRVVDAAGDELVARWLTFYPSTQKQVERGACVRLFGEVREGYHGLEMVHPRVRAGGGTEPLATALTPVYPTTAGLAQSALRKLIARALATLDRREHLPAALCAELKLPAFADAVAILHQPPADIDRTALGERTHPAWRRIKFEEMLAQQLSLRKGYCERRAHRAPLLPVPDDELAARFLVALPFALTGAQARALAEIETDLARPQPMQRLLQGDVGSGKTVVAALAMLRAAAHERQAALMAPTEILAEQHFVKLAHWFAPLGLEVVWLSGRQGKRARAAAQEKLASGAALLAVGTHALLEDPVMLPRLALAVVDEQHRFGVRQRLTLRGKAGDGTHPHMLMMSATPIPRTLAMTHYADLDVSVLDELPPGRTPVRTRLIRAARRDDVVAAVRHACAEGRQVYWVCPLIEESEALQLQTAQDTFAWLAGELADLGEQGVGLVHGRLKPAEKSATMDAFVRGDTKVLVATTVIEVGVDVPNASLMVIEHAERFGLAQLHQLRGRVGRGAARSECVLLFEEPLSQLARARLKVIFEHTDGFLIAQEDLRIRGPGEFIGARQSGVPLLRYADLERDGDLIEAARALAEHLLAHDPQAAEALSERWFGGRTGLLQA